MKTRSVAAKTLTIVLGIFAIAIFTNSNTLAQRTGVSVPPKPALTPRPAGPVVPKNDWVLASPNMAAKFLAFDWNGSMFVVGLDDEIYAAGGGTWTNIKPGLKVKTVTVKPDGTVIAPGLDNKFIHSRTGSTWSKADGYVDQITAVKDGNTYALLDGKLIRQNMGPLPGSEKFKYMAASSKDNSIYVIGQSGKIYTSQAGFAPTEILGGGTARYVAGTGQGVRGGAFILGPGTDNRTFYYEVTPKNGWSPIASQTYMKFIAINPANDGLYGIGVDNKIYRFSGKF